MKICHTPGEAMNFFGKILSFCGLVIFAASFSFNTTPNEMTSPNGEAVKVWTSARHTHFVLALEPLGRTYELSEALNNPSEYGYGQGGDGYEYFLNNNIYRDFYSIPASIGWFAILFSVLLLPPLWKGSLKNRFLRFLLFAGSLSILLAVPLLILDFYRGATVYEGYFHLGSGAYLIVAAYLLIGIANLILIKTGRRTVILK